ncbi:hypothetical protein HQ563_04675 [bacterium]|nr:hypothetical protein [bacterium]
MSELTNDQDAYGHAAYDFYRGKGAMRSMKEMTVLSESPSGQQPISPNTRIGRRTRKRQYDWREARFWTSAAEPAGIRCIFSKRGWMSWG